jgi:hypothetical protein
MYWPEGGATTRLAKGETVRLRYRVLVFAGDPAALDLAQKFAEYTSAKE